MALGSYLRNTGVEMRIGLASASVALLVAVTPALPGQTVNPRVYSTQESDNAPQVDLWLDEVSYRVGDRIAPHFVAEPGAYVTIVRITSDGQIRVLYPQRPRDQRPFQKAQLVNDRVPFYSGDNRFQVYESQGIGFVFAIASFEKFDYSYFSTGRDWSIARLTNDGRYGDPFEIVRRFVDRTLLNANFALDYVSYSVENGGPRSRYASRYDYGNYGNLGGYLDDCVSAFGLRYTSYCQAAYPGYYGPIIVSQPHTPNPNVPSGGNYAGKHIRPVTGDPMVHGAPVAPEPTTEGRLPPGNYTEEAALAARRERMARQVTPRDRSGSTTVQPTYSEPRIYSAPQRTEPIQRQPVERQPVIRAEPRPMPVTPARVEVRNEPRPQPSRSEPAPKPAATPVQKDNQD